MIFFLVFFRLANLALHNVNKDCVIFSYFHKFVAKSDQKPKTKNEMNETLIAKNGDYQTQTGPSVHGSWLFIWRQFLGCFSNANSTSILCLFDIEMNFFQWNMMFNVRKLMFSWKDLLAEVEPSVIKVIPICITSTFLWASSNPPTHYVRKNTVLNISKNGHFPNPPPSYFANEIKSLQRWAVYSIVY